MILQKYSFLKKFHKWLIWILNLIFFIKHYFLITTLLTLRSNNLIIFFFFWFCDIMSFKYKRILIKNTSIREGFARKIERKYFSYYETSSGVLTARTKSLQKLFGKWVFVFPIIFGFALPENLILIITKIVDCWQIFNAGF